MKYLISLLFLMFLVTACVPADRYTTDKRNAPRSRYYSTSMQPANIPSTGESYSEGNTYKWMTSYYGEEFHGRQTASGEIFDMNGMTCAHRELPFNTLLKVTNPVNQQTVNVRVNDRGPFVQGRVLDLAQGAAERIGMTDKGVKELHIEILYLPVFE